MDAVVALEQIMQMRNLFMSLKNTLPTPENADLLKLLLAEAWEEQTCVADNDSKQIRLQIKQLEDRLSYIRDLLSSKQIEPADFREMKSEYSAKLEAKLAATKNDKVNIKELLD